MFLFVLCLGPNRQERPDQNGINVLRDMYKGVFMFGVDARSKTLFGTLAKQQDFSKSTATMVLGGSDDISRL